MTLAKNDWRNILFGKWANVKKARPEELECIIFFSTIRRQILDDKLKAIVFHVPNEYSGDKKPVFGMLQKAMGKISGMADYCVLMDGKGFLIEFKRPDGKGRQSPKQVAVKKWADHSGVEYHLVNTASEALDIIQKHNQSQ